MERISRVLLIKPPLYMTRELMEFLSFPMPLGLMYLASVLEKTGVTVQIIDALIEGKDIEQKINNGTIIRIGLSAEKIAEKIKNFRPDLIGITNLFTVQYPATLEIVKICKKLNPEIPVVVGGVHPSSAPKDCIGDKDIDFVVIGEGEKIIIDIINYLNGKLNLTDLKSCYFREPTNRKDIFFNGRVNLVENLDFLPYPAYHLIDMEAYFKAAIFDATTRGGSYKRWASIITSRGCPYGCIFCSEHLIHGRRWRSHSPEYIFNQIKFLINNYQIDNFAFDDGNFTFDVNRAIEIMDLIKPLNIKFIFPNGIRADRLDYNLAKKLKDSGCQELILAFEHGDQDFLNKVIKKNLNLNIALANLKHLRKLKISLNAFFIFGIPSENLATLNETKKLIYKVAKEGVVPNISLAIPLPGTELVSDSIKKGYLDKTPTPTELAFASHKKYLFKNTELSGRELIKEKRKTFIYSILLVFIFHPIAFFQFPFVRSTLSDLKDFKGFKKRILKLKGIFGYS